MILHAKYLAVLFLIILLGFFLRTFHLSNIPSGLFADEAAIGYNAYSLGTKGTDEYGVRFPFFFQSFGDYRLPIPIYSNIPFIAFLGLNEFSVRMTAAFFGTSTILVLFLLSKKLFRSSLIGLGCSFFLAISPWHIHFSRFGSEYIYFPFWFCLGLYLFLLGLERRNFLFFSFFVFGISLYTYYPALFIVPLFVALLILFYFRQLIESKKTLLLCVLIFLLSLVPFAVGVENGTVLTRWQNVSVFKEANEGVTKKMIGTYISHFSPDFLFAKGDIEYPEHFIRRFSVRGMGELYWFQLPLVIAGFLSLIVLKGTRKGLFILLAWFALYPLGSTITGTDGGGPFSFRSIFGVIPFQILSAIGALFLFSSVKYKFVKYLLIIFATLVITFSFKDYLHRYFIEYPLYSSDFWGWQFGPRDVMKYFLENRDDYDDLFLMGNFNAPQIFIPFYDPQNLCQGKCQVGSLERIDTTRKQLFAIGSDRMGEISQSLTPIIHHTIYFPNYSPAFYLVEFK